MAEKYEFDGIDGQEWIRDVEDGSMYYSMKELALLLNSQEEEIECLNAEIKLLRCGLIGKQKCEE